MRRVPENASLNDVTVVLADRPIQARTDRSEQVRDARFVAGRAAQRAVHLPATRYRIGRNGLGCAGDGDENDGEAAEG